MKLQQYLESYQHCPVCASKLIRKKDYIQCKKCKHQIFDNAIPAVNVIIENDKNEIILVVRKIDPYKGWLDLPGGFIQSGEDMEQAAKREIKEELGITLKPGTYIGNYPAEYNYNSFVYNILVFVVSGTTISGEIVAGDDVSAVRFVSRNKVLKEKICYPEINKKALKKYIAISGLKV